jgi:hypothetical protein
MIYVRTNDPILDWFYFSLMPRLPSGDVMCAIFRNTIFGDWNHGKGRNFYEEHNERVREIMRENGRPLLKLNARQGWNPLCEFLGKEVPATPYPRTNSTKEAQKQLKGWRTIRLGLLAVYFVEVWGCCRVLQNSCLIAV